MSPVYAITDAKDNADLMVICCDLGYLSDEMIILDATYGQGRFWSKWSPNGLWTNDLDKSTYADLNYDFRSFPADVANRFDAVVFDPPYGYRGTSRLASDADYGLGEYLSVEERDRLIWDGVKECERVLAQGGHLLVKCQDQSVSGAKHWQVRTISNLGEFLGLELEDMLHLCSVRKQPAGKRQKHSWVNYSTLLVFHKPSTST